MCWERQTSAEGQFEITVLEKICWFSTLKKDNSHIEVKVIVMFNSINFSFEVTSITFFFGFDSRQFYLTA